jgi:hypothetical protein
MSVVHGTAAKDPARLRPRVMIYGVGYYGMEAVRILVKNGWPIVAAVNRAGPKIGEDLGRLAGLNEDLESLYRTVKPPTTRLWMRTSRWFPPLERLGPRSRAALTGILWRRTARVRINVLAKFPSHCPVCWHLRGIARLRGTPIAPRLGDSGVGLPGHRRGLNKARKNTAGRN